MKRKLSILVLASMLLSVAVPSYAATYKTNQHATAYVNDPDTASEKENEIGYVAVHPKVKGTHKDPVIPFGTYIYIDKVVTKDGKGETYDSVFSPEGELTAVKVQDIGDVNYNWSTYFLDFYFGDDLAAAKEFGVCRIDYHY